MGFAVLTKRQLVEIQPARFAPHVFMDGVSSMFFQSETICDWFTCGLDAKVCVGISKREALSICCTKPDTILIRVHSSELRNVVGDTSGMIGLRALVDGFYFVTKVHKVRDNHFP